MQILETKKIKIVKSDWYNTVLNKETGEFARWGKTEDDDPQYAPMPEIADIEISSGMCQNSCEFCYKGNIANGELHNMTFEQFKTIFHKIAGTVVCINKFGVTVKHAFKPYIYNSNNTKKDVKNYFIKHAEKDSIQDIQVYNEGLLNQIAFGITSPTANPDFFKMMEYAKEYGVMPNYTCNGVDMTEDIAEKTAKLCGGCAISVNKDKEKSYDAVQMLSNKGIKQINLHIVAMDSTFGLIKQILNDTVTDQRLKGLYSIVLLKYKPKGTNAGLFKPLKYNQYVEIFELAKHNGVVIGFDSCSAPVFIDYCKKTNNASDIIQAEPCESTLFSIYVNSYGKAYPCSFCENMDTWEDGIDLLTDDSSMDFKKSIWDGQRFLSFRNTLLANNRCCPVYTLD